MRPILLLLCMAFCVNAHAQDDVFALSPFTVDSSDDGYMATSTLAGTRISPNGYSSYNAPIKLRRKADSVTLSIYLTNASRKASERNDQIMETVTKIIETADKTEGIRAHNGEISLSTRNKKVSIFASSNESSQVRIYVLGDLKDGEDVFQKTSELKEFLESITPVGDTELVSKVGMHRSDSLVEGDGVNLLNQIEPGSAVSGGAAAAGCTACR